jgi:hypothetical protein
MRVIPTVHRWLVIAVAFGICLVPVQPAEAQTTTNAACQQLIAQTLIPTLANANRYNPSGVFPIGAAPMMQPFATNPNEYLQYGYPQLAYQGAYAWPNDPTVGIPTEPDPRLTAAAVLDRLQGDGTLSQMSPNERATVMASLAGTHAQEEAQNIARANLRSTAQRNIAEIRRIPYDLSIATQASLRNWRDAYNLSAQTGLQVLQAACNPAAAGLGIAPVAPTPLLPCAVTLGSLNCIR